MIGETEDLAIPEADIRMMMNYGQLDEFSKRRIDGLVSRIRSQGFSSSEFRAMTDDFLQGRKQ
jgi:hypothetical protein